MISIVVATKEAEKFIERLLTSLDIQTSTKFELIVMDCDSEDRTVEIIVNHALCSKVPVKLTRRRDRGIYQAWNRAISEVSSDWVLFMGADDCLADRTAIERATIAVADAPNSVDYFSTPVNICDRRTLELRYMAKIEKWNKQALDALYNKFQMLPHQGMLTRVSILRGSGRFDESYKIVGDYEQLVRCVNLNNLKILDLDPIVSMASGGISSGYANKEILIEFSRASSEFRHTNIYLNFYFIKFAVRWAIIRLIGEKVFECIYLWSARAKKVRL